MDKSELYHPSLQEIPLANVLRALGDPTRLQIARTIYAAGKPLTCLEAVKGIDHLAISTRSHCYKLLREGGVIRSEKHGRESYNSIRSAELEKKFPGLIALILS